jgi:hypothetical protein
VVVAGVARVLGGPALPVGMQKVLLDLHSVLKIMKVNMKIVQERWLDQLDDEDLAFLKRFLLSSGTIKELARQYGVSYPTVRLRLDRLIEKVKLIDAHETESAFEQRIRVLYAEGRLDDRTFRDLLTAYREETETP